MLITLNEAKAHLNVTTDDDDALITSKIEAATSFVQQYVTVDLSSGDLPGALREAVRRVTADLYDNRGDASLSIDNSFLSLIGPYRKWVF